MKNIWKNAILFLSLIGLMTFVSSCSSDDPTDDPEVPTDIVYKMTAFENNQEVSFDFSNVTATVSGTNVVIAGIPDGTTGLEPSTMKNGTQALTEFLEPFTSGSLEGDTAVLYFKADDTAARVKGVPAEFTYTFAKQ